MIATSTTPGEDSNMWVIPRVSFFRCSLLQPGWGVSPPWFTWQVQRWGRDGEGSRARCCSRGSAIKFTKCRELSLNKFLSIKYSTVIRHSVVHQISRIYLSCITEIQYMLISNSLFLPHARPLETTVVFSLSISLSHIPHISRFMQYLSLCD